MRESYWRRGEEKKEERKKRKETEERECMLTSMIDITVAIGSKKGIV